MNSEYTGAKKIQALASERAASCVSHTCSPVTLGHYPQEKDAAATESTAGHQVQCVYGVSALCTGSMNALLRDPERAAYKGI